MLLLLTPQAGAAPCGGEGQSRCEFARATFTAKPGCGPAGFLDPRKGGECWSCPQGYERTLAPVSDADACRRPARTVSAPASFEGKLGCQGRGSVDPRNGGECWACPAGFERSLAPVTANNACVEPAQTSAARAEYREKASCPRGSFLDARNGGECWSCPSGYKRGLAPVSAANACATDVPDEVARAKFRGRPGCDEGTFLDPRKGECWSCPSGYERGLAPVSAENACTRGGRGRVAKAGFKGKAGCPRGSFLDPRNGGECWACPASHRRTLAPVTAKNACAASGGGTSRAKLDGKLGCPEGSFLDARNGGECWACPARHKRSVFPVTGAKACTVAAGLACAKGLADVGGVCRSPAAPATAALTAQLSAPSGPYVATQPAAVREGPWPKAPVLEILRPGTAVTVTGTYEGWYRVALARGRVGYVLQGQLRRPEQGLPAPSAPPPPAPAAAAPTPAFPPLQAPAGPTAAPDGSYVATQPAAVREGPWPRAPLLEILRPGARAVVTGTHEGWYRVALAQGRVGYVLREQLRLEGGTPAPSAQPAPRTTPQVMPRPARQPAPQATPAVGVFPAKLRPGTGFKDCPRCPRMVVVPPGRFDMGAAPGERGRDGDEGPRHGVTISYPFAIGKYEVTFEEWDACVAGGGCRHVYDRKGWGRGSRPAINLTWNDAKAYVRWLARHTGKAYRLPSEAEWEYAARAGTTTARHWGQAIGRNNANCDGCGSRWDNRLTAPVGSFAANGFGLHDMLGNAWEWVADCYSSSYAAAPPDGGARIQQGCTRGVMRGGSWESSPRRLRAANRQKHGAREVDDDFGLRVVRELGE